jgi:hypothetical protein
MSLNSVEELNFVDKFWCNDDIIRCSQLSIMRYCEYTKSEL